MAATFASALFTHTKSASLLLYLWFELFLGNQLLFFLLYKNLKLTLVNSWLLYILGPWKALLLFSYLRINFSTCSLLPVLRLSTQIAQLSSRNALLIYIITMSVWECLSPFPPPILWIAILEFGRNQDLSPRKNCVSQKASS